MVKESSAACRIRAAWSEYKGYVVMQNPIDSKLCYVQAKGLPSWIFERISKSTSAGVTDETPAPIDPPAYVARCEQCGGIRWGCIRTKYNVLPSGEHRPYEAWGCLDCTGKQCPQCHGRNLVTDRAGTYCVDCLERPLKTLTDRQGV